MDRRWVLRQLAALAAVIWAPRGLAQEQGKTWRLGLLRFGNRGSAATLLPALQLGLRDFGYIEGRNLVLEQRFAEGSLDRLNSLAAELVRLRVDAIVATDSEAVRAAQKATSSIPIVMTSAIDPIASGFVKSLAHPGGNTTGISNMTGESYPKLLELLIQVVPNLSRVALLLHPENPAHSSMRSAIESFASKTGIRMLVFQAITIQQIDAAFAMMDRERAEALIVATDAFFVQERQAISSLAVTHRLPSISGLSLYAKAGLLMSYGSDLAANWRQSARYIDKILKGAKPGDLPVEQAPTFDLLVNLKTAKAIGLNVPKEFLLRAREVIE